MSTTLVNLKQKNVKYDVYIGRPSKWGNPYSHRLGTLAEFKVDTREEAISKYETHIRKRPDLMADIEELRDKVLGCWCWPLECHGNILIKLLKERDNNVLCPHP